MVMGGEGDTGTRPPIMPSEARETMHLMLALYLNVFILLAQAFLRVSYLQAWAPTQTEPAFLVAQGSVFLLFVDLTILTAMKFPPVAVTV